jgi:hypothetical protein
MRYLLATIFCCTIVTAAAAKEPDIKCIIGTGDRVEEQVAPPVGTVVGVVVGAAASDGNIGVTIVGGNIGCDVGKVFGQAWAKTHDNAAVIAKGMSYRIQKNTSTQAVVQFLGVAPDAPPKGPDDVVLSLDPGMNAIAIPLTDGALKKFGVSDADRKNILVFMTPVDPGNFNQHVSVVKKVLGIGH